MLSFRKKAGLENVHVFLFLFIYLPFFFFLLQESLFCHSMSLGRAFGMKQVIIKYLTIH